MITYVKGNLFDNLTTPSCIVHIVNNRGLWGAGFTAGLTENFPQTSIDYQTHYKEGTLTLGSYFKTQVGNNSQVFHLVGQFGVYNKERNPRPIDYEALYNCLEKSGKEISYIYQGYDVVMPYGIGSGLARGNKNIIHCMINELYCVRYGLDVTFYEL